MPMRRTFWVLCFGLCLAFSACTTESSSSATSGEETEEAAAEENGGTKMPDPEEIPEEPEAIPKSEMKTPWANARVGDWIVMELHIGKTMSKKFEVMATDETTVTMAIKDPDTDEVSREETIDLMDEHNRWVDPEEMDMVKSVEDVELEIDGKKYACKKVVREFGERKTATWYCKDIPLNNGVVRSEKNDSLMQEVVKVHLVERE